MRQSAQRAAAFSLFDQVWSVVSWVGANKLISLPELEFAVVAGLGLGATEWAQLVHRIGDLGYDALMIADHLQLRLAVYRRTGSVAVTAFPAVQGAVGLQRQLIDYR